MATNRFAKKKYIHSEVVKTFLYILMFVAIIVVFFMAISNLQATSVEEQAKNLETAIRQSAVNSYTLNGKYPQTFEELEKNYDLMYNKELFHVHYETFASNLMPDITVIVKK